MIPRHHLRWYVEKLATELGLTYRYRFSARGTMVTAAQVQIQTAQLARLRADVEDWLRENLDQEQYVISKGGRYFDVLLGEDTKTRVYFILRWSNECVEVKPIL